MKQGLALPDDACVPVSQDGRDCLLRFCEILQSSPAQSLEIFSLEWKFQDLL